MCNNELDRVSNFLGQQRCSILSHIECKCCRGIAWLDAFRMDLGRALGYRLVEAGARTCNYRLRSLRL